VWTNLPRPVNRLRSECCSTCSFLVITSILVVIHAVLSVTMASAEVALSNLIPRLPWRDIGCICVYNLARKIVLDLVKLGNNRFTDHQCE